MVWLTRHTGASGGLVGLQRLNRMLDEALGFGRAEPGEGQAITSARTRPR